MTDANIMQLFGIIYLAVGLGLVLNPGFDKKLFVEMLKNTALKWTFSIVALTIGFLMVTSPERSTEGWSLLILAFGWIALVKGTIGLLFPQSFEWIVDLFMKSPSLLASTRYLLIGGSAFMIYLGFYVL